MRKEVESIEIDEEGNLTVHKTRFNGTMLCPLRCTAAISRCRTSCSALYVSETDTQIEAYCHPFFDIFAKKENNHG
jgi:hypothetical protein